MIGRQVIKTNRAFTLEELEQFMQENWDKDHYKAQTIGWLTAMAGAAAGKPGMAGTGLLAATKNEQATVFSKVKRMRSFRAFHTIKLDSLLNHNQIYAEPKDFDFVLEYISKRIPRNSQD